MIDRSKSNFRLAGLNDMERDSQGVWSSQDCRDFHYSDGAQAEQWLAHTFRECSDLSVMSEQLEAAIIDWPSEYHLTFERGNLFRALDLSGMHRVLEVGCGCGAVTRFLGEAELQVDALEGDANRARLAATRVADLQNVEVSCANFNQLKLPENTYDAVIYIGVLEYAARFRKISGEGENQFGDDNHRRAIVEILKASRRALNEQGVAIVAIENRLGLKYLLGAREDHYATTYEGLYDYPNDAGIRTFSRNDWLELADQAGYQVNEFLYPFPDYKLPRVVLGDEFLRTSQHAGEILHGIQSRDYVSAADGLAHEQFVRDGLTQSGNHADLANSFLMVLGDQASVEQVCRNDFVHVSGRGRSTRFRTLTAKAKSESFVTKTPLLPTASPAARQQQDKQQTPDYADADLLPVTQRFEQQAYVAGKSLARVWGEGIRTRSDIDGFVEDVSAYRHFLQSTFETDLQRRVAIDAMASNILVDGVGNWHVIDLEWETAEPIAIDFVVFRSLLYFFIDNPDLFRILGQNSSQNSLDSLIKHLCDRAGINAEQNWNDWLALEDRFQRTTASGQRSMEVGVALAQSPSAERFEARVYWSKTGEPSSDDSMLVAHGWEAGGRQVLKFQLPSGLGKVKFIRFDPTETIGYFHLYSMKLGGLNQRGERVELMKLEGGEQIRGAVDLVRVDYARGNEKDVYVALDDDPLIHLDVEAYLNDDIVGGLLFEVEMDCPRSRDYRVMADRFLGDIDRLEALLEGKEEELKQVKDVRSELAEIKNSRVWRGAERLRYLFYKRSLARFPLLQNLFLKMSRGGIKQTAKSLIKGGRSELAAPAADVGVARVEAEARHSKYDQWRDARALTEEDRNRYRERIAALPEKPLISIVMPVYNVDGKWLEQAIQSVRDQLYENWELIIIDDNSDHAETRKVLDWLSVPRITMRRLDRNRNISGATNEGIRMATGSHIAFLDHDDALAENALAEVVFAIVKERPDAIYTDEDFVTLDGRHVNPHFKPDYSPDLLLSHNYITHLSVVRRELVDKIDGLRSDFDGAQDYDFWLRVAEQTDRIFHIPKVLYHWRMVESSTSLDAEAKPAALEASKRALQETLDRRGEKAKVLHGNIPYFFRVKRDVADRPENRVSIVIPFKDKPDLLDSSIGRMLEVSSYQNFEILGISNNSERESTFDAMRRLESADSRVRFIEHNNPFNFSELCNFGASNSHGEYLAFVNNDIEVINWDWIECLLEHAQRPEVGVVGGKLYYPDNTIQHAGIIVGIGGYAGHPHKNFNSRRSGYFNRASIQQNLSAVTGAFLMVRRSTFDTVGGFDEENFKIACNDVDFCLRVRQLNLLNVFTPYAQAYHHESVSRGYEDTPEKKARFEAEKSVFQQRHKDILKTGDPYFNPNFALDNEHFGIKV